MDTRSQLPEDLARAQALHIADLQAKRTKRQILGAHIARQICDIVPSSQLWDSQVACAGG